MTFKPLLLAALIASAAQAEDIPVAWTDDAPPSCCYNVLRGTKADGSDLAYFSAQVKTGTLSFVDVGRPAGTWCYAVRRVSAGEEKDADGVPVQSNVRCRVVPAKPVVLVKP